MFADINSFLSFGSVNSDLFRLVGVCEKCTDSSFLFHHFLYFLLSGTSDNKVCLLSFTQSFNHFNSVGNKTGCNLTAATKQGRFLFIDGLRLLGSISDRDNVRGDQINLLESTGKISIKNIFRFITDHLQTLQAGSVKLPSLIIDNLSVLIDLGCSGKDIICLVHYLRSFYVDCQAGMIVLGLNADLGEEDEENSELWKYIQHCSSLSLTVSGLDTGYCKEVHGQITAKWQNTTSREKTKEKKTQFKLTDKTCVLFASGLSSAVL